MNEIGENGGESGAKSIDPVSILKVNYDLKKKETKLRL